VKIIPCFLHDDHNKWLMAKAYRPVIFLHVRTQDKTTANVPFLGLSWGLVKIHGNSNIFSNDRSMSFALVTWDKKYLPCSNIFSNDRSMSFALVTWDKHVCWWKGRLGAHANKWHRHQLIRPILYAQFSSFLGEQLERWATIGGLLKNRPSACIKNGARFCLIFGNLLLVKKLKTNRFWEVIGAPR
jgi:hypothetical protein